MKRFLVSIYFLLYFLPIYAGEIFYVSTTGNDINDGKTWATAFANVQTAIDAAGKVASYGSPSQVWIAKGTYKHGSAMTMKSNVEIYGGFEGIETRLDQRTKSNETILDGSNLHQVFNNSDITGIVSINDITIQNGYSNSDGGGIYNYNTSITINNVKFIANKSKNGGGIAIISRISAYTSSAKKINISFVNCTFSNNSANKNGGAIYTHANSFSVFENKCEITAILNNCTFIFNDASNGGAIYNNATSASDSGNTTISNLDLKNVTLYSNRALYGSAIYNHSASYSIRNPQTTASICLYNCTLSSNTLINQLSSDRTLENSVPYNQCYYSLSIIKMTNCLLNAYDLNGFPANYITEAISTKANTITTLNNCLEQTNSNLLKHIGNYGGNIYTIPVQKESPAINAGIIDENIPVTDARGFTRSVATPTIGAYEYIEPIITQQPENKQIFLNQNVSFNLLASTEAGNLLYQWQKLNSNAEWQNIDGEKSSTLILSNCHTELNKSKYRCIISNEVDNVSIISNEVMLSFFVSPYQEWAEANGLGIDASPTATPHNDGITNMEKFAFGLDASKATSYNSNTNFVHASDGTSASLQFPISIEAESSIQVKALMSTDLINWAETTVTAIGTSTDGKFNLYKATSEIPQNGKVFLKLQVDEK